MSEGTVANTVKCSKMGKQMFTLKSEVVSQTSVASDDLLQSVDQKICERRHFTISELACEFPQISHTLLSTSLSQFG
jgi:hypothetical protein